MMGTYETEGKGASGSVKDQVQKGAATVYQVIQRTESIVTYWYVYLIALVVLILLIMTLFFAVLFNDQKGGDVTVAKNGKLPSWVTQEIVEAAIRIQAETSYPASVLLGQMILEGGAAGSELSNPPYHNCLGQKSPSYLENGTVSMATREVYGGSSVVVNAQFSTFASYEDCMRAWGHKFTMPPYVANVSALEKGSDGVYDPVEFITAVWKSGYATDPLYVDLVVSVMNNYDLLQYNSVTVAQLEDGSFAGDVVISGNGEFAHPCPGMTMQTSYFGEIRSFEVGGHKGNDYAAPIGTPTYAAADGVVTIAGFSRSAGNWVVIDHGNGLVTKYMHHSRILVSAGDHVVKGQQIGEVGSTGMSTGPHLHFQVEENGVPVHPDKYLGLQ